MEFSNMTENCFDQGINGSDTSFPKKLFTQSMLTVGSVSNAHSQYINNGSFSPQTSHIPTNEPIVEQLDWPILSEPDSNDVSLHPTTQHAFVIGNTSTMTTSDHPNEVVNQGKAKPNDTDFVHEVCGELLSYMIKDDAQSEVSTESVFNSILQYPQTATEDHNSSFLLECQTMRKVGQQDVEDGLLQDDSRLSTSARKQGGAEIDYSGLSFVTQNEGLSHTATANVNFENQLTDATDQQPNMLGVDYIGPSFISQNEGLSDTADATINFENLLTDATNEQPNMSGVDISGPSFITQNEFLLDTGNANVNLENLLTDAANQQQWTDVDTANGFQDPANFLYPENIASNRSVLSSSPTDISALNSQSVTPLTTINLREFNNNMQTGGCIGGSNERSEMLSESDFGESFSDDIPSVVYSSENSDNGQSTMDFERTTSPYQHGRPKNILEFLKTCLNDTECNPSLIEWISEEQGHFRFNKKSKKRLADLWNQRKDSTSGGTWANFTRALRYYYPKKGKNQLKCVPGTKLQYRFL